MGSSCDTESRAEKILPFALTNKSQGCVASVSRATTWLAVQKPASEKLTRSVQMVSFSEPGALLLLRDRQLVVTNGSQVNLVGQMEL
jgi:hypothetical protein